MPPAGRTICRVSPASRSAEKGRRGPFSPPRPVAYDSGIGPPPPLLTAEGPTPEKEVIDRPHPPLPLAEPKPRSPRRRHLGSAWSGSSPTRTIPAPAGSGSTAGPARSGRRRRRTRRPSASAAGCGSAWCRWGSCEFPVPSCQLRVPSEERPSRITGNWQLATGNCEATGNWQLGTLPGHRSRPPSWTLGPAAAATSHGVECAAPGRRPKTDRHGGARDAPGSGPDPLGPRARRSPAAPSYP